jgi:hypothetical protein
MNSKYIDFSGSGVEINDVHLLKESISYYRTASIVSNAFLNGLVKSGLSIDQAFNVYTSKAFRLELDSTLEDKLEKVAFKAGKEVGEDYKKLYKINKKDYGWINDELDIGVQAELEKRLEWAECE